MGDQQAATPGPDPDDNRHNPEERPADDATGRAAVRIGDAERHAVVDMLSQHAVAGRLTLDEFAERAGQVFAARTWDDLGQLLADLPAELSEAPPSADPRRQADRGSSPLRPPDRWEPGDRDAPPSRRKRRKRRVVAIMSGTSARGRWWVPRKVRAFAWWGGVKIDLRDAVISTSVVHIKASAYMGQVSVIVPEGIPVDMYGLVLMGGTVNHTRAARPLPGAPLVRVKARGLWGGVVVRTGKARTGPSSNPADTRPETDATPRSSRLDARISRWEQHVEAHRAKWERRAAEHRAAWEDAEKRHKDKRGRHCSWGSSGGWGDTGSEHHGEGRTEVADADPPRDSDRHQNEDDRRGTASPEPPEPAAALPPVSEHDRIPLPVDLTDIEELAKLTVGDKLRALADRIDPGERSASGTGPADDSGADRSGTTPVSDTSASRLPPGTLTMLVTDIVRSTQLAGELGDQQWMRLLRVHNQLVRGRVSEHGGTEVKNQGDGFLMAFPSARRAILAAVDIQRALAAYRADQPEHKVELRVGLHTGEVVTDEDDIHGQNVVIAVRIADAAAPNEILVSDLTRDLTASSGDLRFGPRRELALKGLPENRGVHEVLWES